MRTRRMPRLIVLAAGATASPAGVRRAWPGARSQRFGGGATASRLRPARHPRRRLPDLPEHERGRFVHRQRLRHRERYRRRLLHQFHRPELPSARTFRGTPSPGRPRPTSHATSTRPTRTTRISAPPERPAGHHPQQSADRRARLRPGARIARRSGGSGRRCDGRAARVLRLRRQLGFKQEFNRLNFGLLGSVDRRDYTRRPDEADRDRNLLRRPAAHRLLHLATDQHLRPGRLRPRGSATQRQTPRRIATTTSGRRRRRRGRLHRSVVRRSSRSAGR